MRLAEDIWISRRAIAAFVAVGFGWASFTAQMPAIKARVDLSDGAYGALVLVGSVGALLAMWLGPWVHARLGRHSVALGAVVMVCGFMATGLTTDARIFTLGLFLAAAGSGVTDVLGNAEVSAQESASGRKLMNLNHGLFSVAYALSALSVGAARAAGWEPWQVFAGLAVACAFLLPVLRAPQQNEGTGPETGQPATGATAPMAIVWTGGLVVLAAFLAEAATEGWSALHVERTLEGGPAQGAMGPAILGASMATGRLAGHILTADWDSMRVIVLASLIAAAGLFMAGTAPNLPLAYLGFALTGLGTSVIGPLALGLVGQAVPRKFQLTAISRAAALGYGAFFLGPVLMGGISQLFGLRVSFGVVSVLMLGVALFLIPALRRQVQACTG